MPRLLFDSHLDLAWNGASFDRDLTLPLQQLNEAEAAMSDWRFRGRATVSFPEMRRAGIAVCIATVLVRSGPEHQRQPAYARADLDYPTRLGCYAAAHGQLACYDYWQSIGEIRLLRCREDLAEHDALWQTRGADETLPIGVILSMEGADPVLHPDTLDQWWDWGLRAIEPAHYGRSHYASGTATEGPLTDLGRQLIDRMSQLGIALDVTHLSDLSMAQALERYQGPVWASHHNCRSLVPGDRQLTDQQIRQLVDRGAVIGAAFDAWMLYPGWVRGQTDPQVISLQNAVDHIDHICQIAGSAAHCGIGSDLDGGFGTEQTPGDLRSIADLQRLADILSQRGYADQDIEAIFYENWMRLLMTALPERD